MRIIITGGAGFIGSHFIDYVLDVHPSYEIVCIDKLTYAANPNNLTNAKTHGETPCVFFIFLL